MTLNNHLFDIARRQCLAGRDTEKLTFDALESIVGNLLATSALTNFGIRYYENHPKWGEFPIIDRNYVQRFNLTWNRYARMLAYQYMKQRGGV